MRNIFYILLIFPLLVLADQVKRVEHAQLWLSGTAKTVVGGTISQTEAVDLFINKTGDYLMPNRATVWVSGSGGICEDDTITVYVYGYFNYVTGSCLDTVNVPVDTSNSGAAEFSFTLSGGTGLVDKVKLGFTPEGGSADDSCAIFTKVVLEYGLQVKITGVQQDSDTSAFDATKTNITDYLDSAEVVHWVDTTDVIATVSDTSVMSAQFETKISWSDTAATIITVSDTAVTSAYIAGKADSGGVGHLTQDETVTGQWTLNTGIILPLHTVAEGDSVLGHIINDAADTTLKCWSGSAWITIKDLIP